MKEKRLDNEVQEECFGMLTDVKKRENDKEKWWIKDKTETLENVPLEPVFR